MNSVVFALSSKPPECPLAFEVAADPPSRMGINNVVSRDAFGGEGYTGTERGGPLVYKMFEKPFTKPPT